MDRFRDLWPNQLWQWLEAGYRKPVLNVCTTRGPRRKLLMTRLLKVGAHPSAWRNLVWTGFPTFVSLLSSAFQDGQLSRQEILDKYDLFVGSQATDFGEALTRHDEF